MLRGFLLLAILTWHSTEQFRLVVERSVNSITLICRDQDDLVINVLQNTSVRFYLNQTELANFIRSEIGASFQINPRLEGNYSCGTRTGDGSPLVTVMSQPKPLIALPSTDGFPVNSEVVYAVQSSDVVVTIPCPFEPGNLQNCYFGQWTKDNVEIAKIGKPDGSCANAGDFTGDMSKYQIDRETFSLIISSVTAQDDSGQYQCHLKIVNPATSTGQTEDFRSFSVTLIVDGQPMIIKPPTDVIVGLEQEEKRLTETASFECVALGRPVPVINWYYIVVNKDGSLGEPERLMNNERYRIVNDDGVEDPTGRFNSTSILTMSVIESDGGIIRCQAGTFADAQLTILGEPSIDIIDTLTGEMLIYDIGVKVRLNRPVMLKISYEDDNSGEQLSRDLQPMESYNDTSEITFRENMRDLPPGCKKCRVIVSLTAQMGSQIMQGLSVTSRDVIDIEARTPQETIDHLNEIVIGISTILGIILMIIIVVVSCCLVRARWKLRQNQRIVLNNIDGLKEDVSDMEKNMSNEEFRKAMITRIKSKLKKLENFVTTEFDDISSNAPQVNLKRVEKDLEDILSKFETPQGNFTA